MRNIRLSLAVVHGLALATAIQTGIVGDREDDWLVQCAILLLLSYATSFWIQARAGRLDSLYPLVVQQFLLVVTHYLFGFHPLLTTLLVAVPILELLNWYLWPVLWVVVFQMGLLFLMALHPFEAWNWTVEGSRPIDLGLTGILATTFTVFAGTYRSLSLKAAAQATELTDLNRAVGNLMHANLDFQDYAVKVGETSTIQERKRLSREIHDVVGYTLTNLRMMIEHAIDLAQRKDPQLDALLAEARNEVLSGLQETRVVLRQFREIENSTIEGIPYLQKLVKTFSHATGIDVRCDYGNLPWVIPPELSPVLYRIVQESMVNAFRHGRATVVQIRFWLAHARLVVIVSDNGTGGAAQTPGIGLTGMAERISPLGGVLTAEGGGAGFTVRVEIPIAEEQWKAARGLHGA